MSDIEMAQPQGNDSLAQVVTPSPPHEQQQQQRQEITVGAPAAPAAEAAEQAVDSTAQDVNTSPTPPQEKQEITVANISPEAVDAIIRRYKSFPKSESEELDDLRGWLVVLATLTASISWNAALYPPGGVWQADDAANRYVAGSPVFRDKNRRDYDIFIIFNITSFISSLFMLVLLSNSWLFRRTTTWVFSALVSLDLACLFATVLFGSTINDKGSPSTHYLIAFILVIFLAFAWIVQIRWRD